MTKARVLNPVPRLCKALDCKPEEFMALDGTDQYELVRAFANAFVPAYNAKATVDQNERRRLLVAAQQRVRPRRAGGGRPSSSATSLRQRACS